MKTESKMLSLEDKILGEKVHNYCSSSESGESDTDSGDEKEPSSSKCESDIQQIPEPSKWEGVSSNTGPKGVLNDWQMFKQLEVQKRKEQDEEKLALMKKLSLTCKSVLEEERERHSELSEDLAELLTDDFLEQYRKQRMKEMLSSTSRLPKFGKLYHLKNGEEFLEAVDNENKSVTVIVHVYENTVVGCKMMNSCLSQLSEEYLQVKFCKLISSAANMSNQFKSDGVPALLVYKAGQMVGNFVRVTDELGDEFYSGDVENFLIEHGMIVDKSCVPKIVSECKKEDSDSE